MTQHNKSAQKLQSIPTAAHVLVTSGTTSTKVRVYKKSLGSPFMNHEVNVISSSGRAILFSNLGFNISRRFLPTVLSPEIFPQFPTADEPNSLPPTACLISGQDKDYYFMVKN